MIPNAINAKDVNKLTQLIYVRYNFEGEFTLLLDFESKPFETINEAHDFLSTHIKGCYWEVSTYEQAIMGNGMRDNV